MARSGSRSPPPSMDVSLLLTDLPRVGSPGRARMWMLAPAEVLAAPVTASPLFDHEYNFATGGSSYHHRNRPSDQYLWDAGHLASLRQEREQLEALRELYMAVNGMMPSLAEFEDAGMDYDDGSADPVPVTTASAPLFGRGDNGTLEQRSIHGMHHPTSYHGNPTGGNSPASMDGMDSDEDYDSDMYSHLAFGMECESPTSSTSSVDFEAAPEICRSSLEISVALSEQEIMSNSAGSKGDHVSNTPSASDHDLEDQSSESSSGASDDSQWATTASSASTPGSDMSHTDDSDDNDDTDDNLQTFDDLTNTIDQICLLVGTNPLAREAFLTYAYILVSHVDEFDNVQVDYLAIYLQGFRDHHQEESPISFFADLCRALGLLGEDGRIPPNLLGLEGCRGFSLIFWALRDGVWRF
ncbi:hypothetical protein KC316_g261 [Hortaea werneckii]|nr:hypothetical protein KC324_g306 [Hortaea werneckii]KAI7595841.1 hypothetical protein KC316_g261 [Hortaea werneckii]